MSYKMNNKKDQILLIDSTITITKINDLKSNTKKIITFDLSSHRLLNENGIEHEISENFISENELKLIDSACLDFCQWYNENNGSDFLSYEGINLGSLFRVELNNFLIPFVRNFLILWNINNNLQNNAFLCSNFLYSIISKFSKHCQIIDKKSINPELTWDVLQYNLTNSISLKISKKNFEKLKSLSQKISSLVSSKGKNHDNFQSYAFVEFDPIKYEKLFNESKNFNENFYLYNRHRPIASNLKSLKIIKNSKIIPYANSEKHQKTLEKKLFNSKNLLIKNFEKFIDNDQFFSSFFMINNLTFWNSFKPFLHHFFISKLEHSITEIEISKNFLSSKNISGIVVLSESGFTEQIMLNLAKQFSLKTILIQHGIILDNELAFTYNKIIGGNLPNLSNKFFVWGTSTFDNITKKSFSKNKIQIHGSPNLDRILDHKSSVNKNPKSILLLATGPRNQQNVGHDVNEWEKYEEIIKKICKTIQTNDMELIIKRHPDMAEAEFSKSFLDDLSEIKIFKNSDIIDSLLSCDLVISVGVTSSIFEAQILEKPVIVISVDYDVYGIPSSISDSCFVTSINEFEKNFSEIIKSNKISRGSITDNIDLSKNFSNLGNSSLSILREIINSKAH